MHSNRYFRIVLSTLFVLVLAGCGGGGSGGDGSDSESSDGAGASQGGSSATLRADAGRDRDVIIGTTVMLDGSSSRASGEGQIGYSWRLVAQPARSSARLTRAQTAAPRFSADSEGTYDVELVISAGERQSAPDRVRITATSKNTRPTARAGANQNVKTGVPVMLDGSDSGDADGDTLRYAWSMTARPAGSQAVLNNANTVAPMFTPDVSGRYDVSLVVTDGTASSAVASVAITAAQGNSAPVAEAGIDQQIATGDMAELDGSASSDADGDALNYRWRIVSQPQGSAAALANPNSAGPSLTTDALGDYVIELVVDDGQADSAADQVTVSAGPVLVLYLYDSDTADFVRVPNQVLTNVNVEEGTGDQTITNVEVGRFIFKAIGRDYTIQNVSAEIIAMPTGRTLEPNYKNFDNRVIPTGSNVQFTTNASSVTGNGVYDFAFTFTVAETGERYRFAYRLNVR